MYRSVLPAALVLSALATSPAQAQAPGYQQIDTKQIMAAYHAEVLQGVNRVMERWGAGWLEDDVDRVSDLYWETATLIPPSGSPLKGQDAIRGYLEQAFERQGAMEAFMLDFDASGGMAVVSGNYMVEEAGIQIRGALTTVYLQRGRTWKIRAQVFTPSEAGS